MKHLACSGLITLYIVLLAAPVSMAVLNINTASADQLQELPGIGPKTAKTIVEYRLQHGPFGSVDELVEVPRIGPKTLAKFRHLIIAGEAGTAPHREIPERGSAATAVPKPTPEPRIVFRVPDGYQSIICWNCSKSFYIRSDCREGFCPYCGNRWRLE